MYTQRQKSRTTWTAGFIPVPRRIQVVCAVATLFFCILNPIIYEQLVGRVSRASGITMKVAAWSSFATAVTATAGIYTARWEREYVNSVLMVNFLPLLGSTIAASCLTAVANTYWWSQTGLWIASITFAWMGMFISLLLFLRAVWFHRYNKVTTPAITIHEPTGQIDVWRHAVVQEDSPLLGNLAQSEVSFGSYAESDYQDFPDRPGSPISTVAGWTTISGTATITQFSEAPPPYTPRPMVLSAA